MPKHKFTPEEMEAMRTMHNACNTTLMTESAKIKTLFRCLDCKVTRTEKKNGNFDLKFVHPVGITMHFKFDNTGCMI